VAELRRRIAEADALLIATPEYNSGMPGVLKNAIDWVSRQPKQPLAGKPLAMMGATLGGLGTYGAQINLRQVVGVLDARLLNRPSVMIAKASQKFDAEGRLTDPETRDLVKKQLEALAAWVPLCAR
jgi:chromate reductase, NAD(P)H dehydrogenase (quinone)